MKGKGALLREHKQAAIKLKPAGENWENYCAAAAGELEKREGNKRRVPARGKENFEGEGERVREALCAKVNMGVERAAGEAWQCRPSIGEQQ